MSEMIKAVQFQNWGNLDFVLFKSSCHEFLFANQFYATNTNNLESNNVNQLITLNSRNYAYL